MPARPSSAAAERAHQRASRAARRTARAITPDVAAMLAPVASALTGAKGYADARRAILKAAHRSTPQGLAPAVEALLRASYGEGEASADG